LETVQKTWTCLVFHFFRVLQAVHPVYMISPCSSSDSSSESVFDILHLANVLRISSLYILSRRMMHFKVLIWSQAFNDGPMYPTLENSTESCRESQGQQEWKRECGNVPKKPFHWRHLWQKLLVGPISSVKIRCLSNQGDQLLRRAFRRHKASLEHIRCALSELLNAPCDDRRS